MQPTSRVLSLATGLRYHVLEWPAESDHTVVLVHGFLDLAWGWQAMVETGLAGRFHVIAPDMRGHGESEWIGAGGYYHFFDYLADLHDVIGQLGRARVSLVGHSMGGTICSYYAGSYPQRIARLAMLEGLGPAESDMSAPERVAAWVHAWKRARAEPPRGMDSLDEAADRIRKNDPLLDPARARWLAERATVKTEDGRLRFRHDPLHLTMGPYPFRLDVARAFWQRITCPVLLVDGSESALPKHVPGIESRAAAIQHAERAVLAGAGHAMQRHQPAALAELLVRFLDAPGGAG